MGRLIEIFAENVQRLRKNSGISQEELAEEIGVARNTIARYESGESAPSFDAAEKIASYFGIDPALLFMSEETRDKLKLLGEIQKDAYLKSLKRSKASIQSYKDRIDAAKSLKIIKKQNRFTGELSYNLEIDFGDQVVIHVLGGESTGEILALARAKIKSLKGNTEK